MSKMAELHAEIMNRLKQGFTVKEISDSLDCPIIWVIDVREQMECDNYDRFMCNDEYYY